MISDAFIHKSPSKSSTMPHPGPSAYFRYRFNPSGRLSEDGWAAGDGSWADNDVSDVAGIYYAFQSKAKHLLVVIPGIMNRQPRNGII